MQNKTFAFLLSPFFFCFVMGSLGVGFSLYNLGNGSQIHPYQLVIASILGLIAGLSIFMLERVIYNFWHSKNKRKSSYEAWLWKATMSLFMIAILFLDKTKTLSSEQQALIVFAGSVHLLTLSYLFFRAQNSEPLIFN